MIIESQHADSEGHAVSGLLARGTGRVPSAGVRLRALFRGGTETFLFVEKPRYHGIVLKKPRPNACIRHTRRSLSHTEKNFEKE